MAYDSKTFGQSPFGAAKPDVNKPAPAQPEVAESMPVDDGLDKGPEEFAKEAAKQTSNAEAAPSAPKLKDRFPDLSSITGQLTGRKEDTPSTTQSKSQSRGQSKGTTAKRTTRSKSKTGQSTSRSTTRKSKKSKSAKAVEIEAIESAEAEAARRFRIENRNAYISLVYKTGISGLIWAVLRLLRHELPKDVFAVINIIIHPLVIAAIALFAAVGLTFWLRYLLNDLAIHTQQLHIDAETPDGKNYRPTLEIVGDSLEYNPKLRKNFAALFNAASILICSLASYLMIFAAFPE